MQKNLQINNTVHCMTFELEELDEVNRDNIVLSGLQFMRAITEAYGSEKGLTVWDTITETLGNDIKGAIFFRLMTGDGLSNIMIHPTKTKYGTGTSSSGNFIPYIKVVRTFTGYGLKEAKEFCDQTEAGAIGKLTVPFSKKSEFISALRNVGVNAV